MLIAQGHRHSEILDYSLAQFRRYLELALRRERRLWREQILAANWGMNGGAPLKKALQLLQEAD